MHWFVKQLSRKLGVPIAHRDGHKTWLWDGKTVATFYSNADEPKITYNTNHDLMHELFHWMVAAPEQRDLPEFGMTPGITHANAWGPYGGPYRKSNGDLRYDECYKLQDGLIDGDIQDDQEKMAQILCIHFGPKVGISSRLSNEPDFSWDDYRKMKLVDDLPIYSTTRITFLTEVAEDIIKQVEQFGSWVPQS